jgi:ribosomal protein L37E
MLNRREIHNTAILKPELNKCASVRTTGSHAYTKTNKQCVDCGQIKGKAINEYHIH